MIKNNKLFTILMFIFSVNVNAGIINLEFELDPNSIPRPVTNTATGISVDYALGDTINIEFGFGNEYITISDDDGDNWISPWLLAKDTGQHTIANATLGYRNLSGNVINIPFTLINATSSAWHVGGNLWSDFLGAGQSITLQSFVVSYEVVNANAIQPITGHYFGLNGVTVVTEGQKPNSVDVPEPSSIAIFALGLMGIGLRRKNRA